MNRRWVNGCVLVHAQYHFNGQCPEMVLCLNWTLPDSWVSMLPNDKLDRGKSGRVIGCVAVHVTYEFPRLSKKRLYIINNENIVNCDNIKLEA
jgi:hypothetical protein